VNRDLWDMADIRLTYLQMYLQRQNGNANETPSYTSWLEVRGVLVRLDACKYNLYLLCFCFFCDAVTDSLLTGGQ
jgi:hypothetical protein